MAIPLSLISLVLLIEGLHQPHYRDGMLRLSLACALLAAITTLL